MRLPLLDTKWQHLYDAQTMPSKDEIFTYAYHRPVATLNPLDQDVPRKRKILYDWIGVICILVLVGLCYLVFRPPIQYFRVNDTSLSYPYIGVYVSSPLVALLSLFIPVMVILLFHLFFAWDRWDLYAGIFGVILAYSIALFFTGFFWFFVGGLRPHFLSICQVNPALVSDINAYYTTSVCRNQAGITRDTFHGFPSGHATTAFAGATFLSAYLAAHLFVWRNGNAFKVFLVIIPFVYAIWLAFSRLMDFHHSLLQITVGILIGTLAGLLSYRFMYRHGFLLGYGRWAHVPFLWYR